MACSCQKRRTTKYVWTSSDGSETTIYDTEIQAKAKVLRVGGSYTTLGS